jgi:uncharacterized LabA/DUF88 family protein
MGFVSSFSGMLRVMAFIDGGYLEHNIKNHFNGAKIDFSKFDSNLLSYLPQSRARVSYYLVRMYYYDALHEQKSSEEQTKKHEQIHAYDFFELRNGRIKDAGDGKPRQKGVDALIAIDMVSKAYENQYDIAVLLAGDDDFVDVVNAVKNTGKQVYGMYFSKHISDNLKNALDARVAIEGNFATQIRQK